MITGTRLGISGDINKLASIAHSVTHTKNHNFSTIRHFSLGLRPWEKLDCSLIDFLIANDITLSAHPTDINFSETVNIPDLKSLKKALTSWPVFIHRGRHGTLALRPTVLGRTSTEPCHERGVSTSNQKKPDPNGRHS